MLVCHRRAKQAVSANVSTFDRLHPEVAWENILFPLSIKRCYVP